MPQMKEQEKPTGKEQNEMEASKLPDPECKTMGIRMLKELRGRVNELNENLKR